MRLVTVGQEEHYLCAPRPATVESAVGMRSRARDVTVVWERIELPYERIALRTAYGRFLSCQAGDDGPRLTLARDLGPHEAFEEILWPDGEVSFRTCELTFVAVTPAQQGTDAVLACRDTETGPAARFRYVEPTQDLVDRTLEIVEGLPTVPDMPRQFAHSGDVVRDTPRGNGQG